MLAERDMKYKGLNCAIFNHLEEYLTLLEFSLTLLDYFWNRLEFTGSMAQNDEVIRFLAVLLAKSTWWFSFFVTFIVYSFLLPVPFYF